MHALASPLLEGAPRVWLVTRPIEQRTPRAPRRFSPAALLHPIVVTGLFLLASATLLLSVMVMRGTQMFIIDGHGLQPSIPAGSLIIAEPAGDRALVVGEIITIPDGRGASMSGYVTEVVHAADGVRYTVRALEDGPDEVRTLKRSAGIGRVAFFLPGAADVIAALVGEAGRVCAVLFAAAVALVRIAPVVRRRWQSARPGAEARSTGRLVYPGQAQSRIP
jgi:hypothetical protein